MCAARVERADHGRARAERGETGAVTRHPAPKPPYLGPAGSVWTLKRLAEVCHEQGLSDTTLSCPTMLDAIVRLGVSWQRATHWIVSPDPAYESKKTPGPTATDGRQL